MGWRGITHGNLGPAARLDALLRLPIRQLFPRAPEVTPGVFCVGRPLDCCLDASCTVECALGQVDCAADCFADVDAQTFSPGNGASIGGNLHAPSSIARRSNLPVSSSGNSSTLINWSRWGINRLGRPIFESHCTTSDSCFSSTVCRTASRSPFFSSGTAVTAKGVYHRSRVRLIYLAPLSIP